MPDPIAGTGKTTAQSPPPSPVTDGIQNREIYYTGITSLVVGVITFGVLLAVKRFRMKMAEGIAVAVALIIAAVILTVLGKGVDNLPAVTPMAWRAAWGLGLLVWMAALLLGFFSLRRQIAMSTGKSDQSKTSETGGHTLEILNRVLTTEPPQYIRVQFINRGPKAQRIVAHVTHISPETGVSLPIPLQLTHHEKEREVSVVPESPTSVDVIRLFGENEGLMAISMFGRSGHEPTIPAKGCTLTIAIDALDSGESTRKEFRFVRHDPKAFAHLEPA